MVNKLTICDDLNELISKISACGFQVKHEVFIYVKLTEQLGTASGQLQTPRDGSK